MEIFDAHVHIYPHKIADKAVEGIGNFYNLATRGNGISEGILENGKKENVTRYLVHSVATVPKQTTSINDFLAQECEKHSEFTGFGAIHPDMDKPLEEIERIEKLGLKGIKIHPDIQKFNMDDPKIMEIYDFIAGKLPILIHCGDYRYDYSHPRRLARVLDNFPNLTVIGAHFGGWSIFDLAVEYLKDRNCYLDTSSSIKFLGLKRAKELIRIYGADRIVFGTDFPMWSTKDELEYFYNMGLRDDELELILYKNAASLFDTSSACNDVI